MWVIIGDILFYLIIGILLLGGLALTVFALPGVWLIWIAIFGTALIRGFEVIPVWFVILSFFLSLAVTVLDNFVIAYGAKRFGGGKWGMLGAILGAIVGVILGNLPGLIVGPFIGAFALEYFMAKKKYEDAFKAGFGSSVGVILVIVGKFFISLFMIIAYLIIFIF